MCKIVVFYIISVCIHELGHWLAAIRQYKRCDEICIGNGIHFKIGKLRISPIIMTGYVSVEQEVVLQGSKMDAVIFFMSGAFTNLLLAIIGMIVCIYDRTYISLVILNIIQIVMSVFPMFGNDGYNLIRVIIYKKKYDSI